MADLNKLDFSPGHETPQERHAQAFSIAVVLGSPFVFMAIGMALIALAFLLASCATGRDHHDMSQKEDRAATDFLSGL